MKAQYDMKINGVWYKVGENIPDNPNAANSAADEATEPKRKGGRPKKVEE